jgi:ABC-2 type transport system permease protein
MHLGRVQAIVLRYYYLLRGSPARWLPLFVWVTIDILLWGFITRYLNSVTSGMDFVPRLLGAVLFFDFFTRVLHGVAGVFFEDVWSRNFLNTFASPLSISEYLSGLVVTSVGTSMVGLTVMLVLATTVFGLTFLNYGLMIFPFLLILFLFGIALGITGCGIVLRMGPASEWFIWPIPAIVSPFAGVFYPLSTLPTWMQMVAKALPPAYVFEEMRNLVSGREVSLTALIIGGGLAILYIGLACLFFKSVFRYAVRTGLIARYSAESIS